MRVLAGVVYYFHSILLLGFAILFLTALNERQMSHNEDSAEQSLSPSERRQERVAYDSRLYVNYVNSRSPFYIIAPTSPNPLFART